MNITRLQEKLIAAARNNPPGDSVPYAFEKRIMANLAGKRCLDSGAAWAAGLWRAAVSCVAITILLSAWTFFAANSTSGGNDLSQDLDNTLLAGAVQQQAGDMIW